ncbi:MAG: alkaline phosphatase family protein [Nanoarchaeota archaeon]|nr:alkaline phosphatase family protein [Nanoarchaeota archaeon]
MSKVFIFGIDGASPKLIFEEWLDELPTIKKLTEKGLYAKLNSTIPPSTITAWNSMMSGKDSSELGIFSFTYKDKDGQTKLVDSNNIRCDRVWDILSQQNKKSIVLHVPLTYPVKPVNGIMVSGFLALGLDNQSVYPLEIKEKIEQLGNPDFFFDVAVGLGRHKALEIDELLKRVYEMTKMQLSLAKDLLISKEWDFFMTMLIGTDRLQHMIWRHFDKSHRRFIENSPHKNALKNYYIYLDKELAKIIKLLPPDTTTIVVSDHGMIKQEGKINLNNWLMEKGYLVLTDEAQEKIKQGKTRFKFEFVDMEKTKVYGAGAYNARVFLNKQNLGEELASFRQKLIQDLKEIPDDQGNPLDTKVYKKEDIYKKPENPECPDLTVYFDDLRWASNPDLGQEGLYSWESAVGADSAGHARQGIFIIAGDKIKNKGKINDIDIRQVTPTILRIMEVKKPEDIDIQPIKVD